MKKAVTIGLAALTLGLPLTYVIAASRTPAAPVTRADAMPAYELFTRLRTLELEPQGEPIRRGPYYVVLAADARGRTLRVVADAELGDILSIVPARAPLWRPHGAPRIIHIPDPSDVPDASPLPEREWSADAPVEVEEEMQEPSAPPPPHRVRRLRQQATIAPPARTVVHRPAEPAPADPAAAAPPEPAPLDRRNTLSGPPADTAERDSLTPVYPTPRFSGPEAPGTGTAQSPQPATVAAPAADDAATAKIQ